MKKVAAIVLAFGIVLLAGVGYLRYGAMPDPLPPGLESAERLEPGPYPVATTEVTVTDSTRPSRPYGDFSGAGSRTLPTTIWHPEDRTAAAMEAARRPRPLLIYSHGFTSSRTDGAYLARHLASRGYMVAAADFPLTSSDAPDGPHIRDVAHQPGDVRFLIDRILAWNREAGHRFEGAVDEDRIGVVGLSLGGLTSTLAAFHPRLGDPRIDAAASIAGPTFMLGRRFFEHRRVPFLMVGGGSDAVVPFDTNAGPVIDRVDGALLVRIAGGTHTGFADQARMLRFLDDLDEIACAAVTSNVQEDDRWWEELGSSEEGVLADPRPTACAGDDVEETMNPVQQQRITILAVAAFFDAHFAGSGEERAGARRYLTEVLPEELPEVAVRESPSRASASSDVD